MSEGVLDGLSVELSPAFQGVMSISLVVMMFTVALGLRVADFRAIGKEPRAILGGAAAQLIGLPVLTFGLVLLLAPPPSVALGMFVIASCPGGNVSNALTLFARGDTAYSVSLTAISSTTAAILTPVSILFWSNLYGPTAALIHELDIGPLPFLVQTALLLGLPLAAGMLTAERFPEIAERLRIVMQPIALAILVGLIVVGVWSNLDVILEGGSIIFPIVAVHNALAFLTGGLAAWLLSFPVGRIRSLTFEVGIQNTGLGLLILLAQFDGSGGAVAITALWGVWHIIAGFILVLGFRSWDYLAKRRDQTANGK